MTSEPIVFNDQRTLNSFAKGSLKAVIVFYEKNVNNFTLHYDSSPLHYAAMNNVPLQQLLVNKFIYLT
jgi:hypothetical protein